MVRGGDDRLLEYIGSVGKSGTILESLNIQMTCLLEGGRLIRNICALFRALFLLVGLMVLRYFHQCATSN